MCSLDNLRLLVKQFKILISRPFLAASFYLTQAVGLGLQFGSCSWCLDLGLADPQDYGYRQHRYLF